VTTDAVVLHGFDYLESSRIIRLATRDAGLQSVIARGARASRRRFGSGLDLFASGTAHLQVHPGRELQQLVGFDLTSARGALAADLERFAATSAIAEIVLRFAGGAESGELFAQLTHALDALEAAPPSRARDVGVAGAWRLVVALGFAPALDRCSVCHAPISDEAAVVFTRSAGGAACAACAASAPRGRPLPAEARAALRAWTAGADLAVEDPAMRRAHLRLLREFLEHHLGDGRALRAFDAWERGMGATAGSAG